MQHKHHTPPQPIHIAGTSRGEQMVLDKGKEAGRGKTPCRTARDSTGICANDRNPIIPSMPHLPPA
jgi:hypothetical protein